MMQHKDEIVAQGRWLNRVALADWRLLAAVLVLPLAAGLLLPVQAGLLASVLHGAIVEGAAASAMLPQLAWLAAIITARIAIAALGEMLAVRHAEAVKGGLRRTMFGMVLGHRPDWTAARSSGALSSTLIEQVETLDGYLSRYLPAVVQAVILPAGFAVLVFPFDWVVGLLFLVTAPLIPLFMALAGWGAEAASRAQASALNRLGGRFADRLRGLTTLKLFAEDERETARVRAASEELRLRTMRVMRIAFLSSAVLEFFAALGVAGVALYVGLTFLDLVSLRGGAELTLWAGMFCLLMAPEVYAPLRLLAAHYHDRAAARAAADEMVEQLGELPRPQAGVEMAVTPAATGAARLELRRVAIASPDGRPVLSEVDLVVEPGERVAILGTSGIGKSTLLEAVAGLRQASGLIRIDGRAEVDEPALRRRLAMLGQRPRIFTGSIADNIRLGRPDADDRAVRRAAELARVADFADQLPSGLATRLGEDGVGLSGGEIQRVALARIYLRDPGLVLLDEPTAHLDAETEAAVLDGILAFTEGRTLIVATHSLAVAARVDRVFRIAGGHLVPAPRPTGRQAGAA